MALGTFAYASVISAAGIGARYAMIRGASSTQPATASDVQNCVISNMTGLDPTAVTVNTTWSPDNKPGSMVTVDVRYTFHPLWPLSASAAIALESASEMTISH